MNIDLLVSAIPDMRARAVKLIYRFGCHHVEANDLVQSACEKILRNRPPQLTAGYCIGAVNIEAYQNVRLYVYQRKAECELIDMLRAGLHVNEIYNKITDSPGLKEGRRKRIVQQKAGAALVDPAERKARRLELNRESLQRRRATKKPRLVMEAAE